MARAYLAQPIGVLRIPFSVAQLDFALQVARRALGRQNRSPVAAAVPARG
jgi:hypothetical protein